MTAPAQRNKRDDAEKYAKRFTLTFETGPGDAQINAAIVEGISEHWIAGHDAASAESKDLRERLKERECSYDYLDQLRNQKDRAITILHTQVAELRTENEALRAALEGIAKDYVKEGTKGHDCPGCDYDGYINHRHHKECVYVIAKEALQKLDAAKED
jgi:DNA repair exonuclease SbcCD ATPase subunit